MEICLIFYYNSKLLMSASIDYHTEKVTFTIADIHKKSKNKIIFSKYIKTLSTTNKIPLKANCLTTEFKSFPSELSTFNKPRSFPIVIFNCGQDNDAYIIDLNSWDIHHWKLPNLDCIGPIGGAISFVPKYQQLFVCGGKGKQVHSLCFKNKDDLKWSKLQSMNTNHFEASSVVIGNNKLMVIGGNAGKHEMYDIDNNEWKELASSTVSWSSAAVVYNDINHEVYVAGKSGKGIIEHYDIYKNKWDTDSVMKYEFNRYYDNDECFILWLEDNKVLYIANVPCHFNPDSWPNPGGCSQFIDLRIGKKWEKLYEEKFIQNLFRNYTRNNVDLCLWCI
eukprot:207607_1